MIRLLRRGDAVDMIENATIIPGRRTEYTIGLVQIEQMRLVQQR